MRRALASLVVLLMTFALVARTVAAPVIHLHDGAPPKSLFLAALEAAQSEHDHSDCFDAAESVVDPESAAPYAGGSHHRGPDSPMKKGHGKVCDNSGACCGPLALTEASSGVFSLTPAPEPPSLGLSTGIKPDSPDRPPSPLLA
jgi:hypothetical protein